MTYTIQKVFNNNVILATNEHREFVIIGRGIGFQANIGTLVAVNSSMKLFISQDTAFIRKIGTAVRQISDIYFIIASEILTKAKEVTGGNYNSFILISLADHISFAVYRYKNNLNLKNDLLLQIKHFYPNEYKIGIWGLEVVKKEIHVELPIDEAGFTALKFVENDNSNNPKLDSQKIVRLIAKICDIVEAQLDVNLSDGSVVSERFIQHLKYLTIKIGNKQALQVKSSDLDKKILDNLVSINPKSAQVIKKIEDEIMVNFSLQEKIYLTTHILQLLSRK